MERYAQVAPEAERQTTLRKLATELEDRDPARAATAYESMIAGDPVADDAFIRAGSEHFDIFLPRPIGVIKFMRRIKMLFSTNVNHPGKNFTNIDR
jgi:hypothetical protein